jgi:arylsulfatase A-like enzyme
MAPNVICIVLDATRADALEPYGAPAGASPAVAQLAGSGRALERMYATACWTLPSHASMFLGKLPGAAGVGGADTPREETARVIRAQADSLLAEVLRRNGYATGGVSANPWITKPSGFNTGFERFTLLDHARAKIEGRNPRWIAQAARSRVDDGARQAQGVLASWLADRDPDRPFFWFVNLVEAHSPYLPPRPYNDLALADRVRAGLEARRHLGMVAVWRKSLTELDMPAEALERIRHLYARSVRYMDDWVAALLERLDAAGVLPETTFIVTADHGENLGENGLLGHCFSLDDRLIRVPFVASGPGAGGLPDGVTSLADLPRLIAGLAGIEDHPWAESATIDGVAVAENQPPVVADDPRAEAARRDWDLDEAAFQRLTGYFECATDGRLKLLRTGSGRESLIDLEADPLEVSPVEIGGAELPPERAAEVAKLRAALTAGLAGPEPAPVASEAVEAPEADPEEVADLEDRMRLLGYM